MSPFWILLELSMIEVVLTTGAVRRAKLQSNRHHQQNIFQLFYRSDALPVVQRCQSMEWDKDKSFLCSFVQFLKTYCTYALICVQWT